MDEAQPTILVIEDDWDLREVMSKFISREGYGVETAASGREALGKLQEGLRPSVIIMDLMMPDMDGMEFREEQMADPEISGIPLITYSGVDDVYQYAERLHADAYIQKPAEFGYIMATVRECIK